MHYDIYVVVDVNLKFIVILEWGNFLDILFINMLMYFSKMLYTSAKD
jgi:hypothetical protein